MSQWSLFFSSFNMDQLPSAQLSWNFLSPLSFLQAHHSMQFFCFLGLNFLILGFPSDGLETILSNQWSKISWGFAGMWIFFHLLWRMSLFNLLNHGLSICNFSYYFFVVPSFFLFLCSVGLLVIKVWTLWGRPLVFYFPPLSLVNVIF